jgi:antagonist of KipI
MADGMSEAGICRVLDAGFLSTVQDAPRLGFARYGLSEAGAMAPVSFLEANYLAGNEGAMAAIEVTVKPPRLLFLAAARIGLAGMDFGWKVDGRPVGNRKGLEVRAGAVLHGEYCRNGMRGYVAVEGGFAARQLGRSRATHLQAGFGGLRLERGVDIGFVCGARSTERLLREVAPGALMNGGRKVLRVVDSIHGERFAPEAMSLLCGGIYRVAEQSNRMALRVEGPALPAPQQAIASAGAWRGAVQVPPSGVPQVLGAEHPATGGYPILASVIQADWETLGQLRPREEILFGKVSVETARALLRRQREWWMAVAGGAR